MVTVERFFTIVDSFMVSQLHCLARNSYYSCDSRMVFLECGFSHDLSLTGFVEILVTVVTFEWYLIVQVTDISEFFATAVTVPIIKLMGCCPK